MVVFDTQAEVSTLEPTQEIDRALAAAARFIAFRQSPDGAWRSDTYGVFKDGASLTPLVIQALLACPGDFDEVILQGCEYLAGMVQPDGTIEAGPHGLSYPLYTAAGAVVVLSAAGPRYRRARNAWLAMVRRRQLTEALGWQPDDREYGGWGFSQALPRKPAAGETAPPFTESNLSSTLFALEALRAVDDPADRPALHKALTFVERCQNYRSDPEDHEPAYDDGGFFFIYDDALRNKAGVAGIDKTGRSRYVSYGSTTADGLRCLLACGLPLADERVTAARHWLERNFSAALHPGRYAGGREAARQAVYYYYCWSLSRAFEDAGVREVFAPGEPIRWPAALADELMQRQQADGSWVNAAVEVREDDAIVATSLALTALAGCRRIIVEE